MRQPMKVARVARTITSAQADASANRTVRIASGSASPTTSRAPTKPVDHSNTKTQGTNRTAPNGSGTVRAVSLIDRDARAVATIEKLRFFDLAVVGGSGSRLRLEDGREVLDLAASWGAVSLGNASPDVAAAVARARADMPGASILSLVNGPAVELAERILATLGDGPERRVWLGHSGSDANDTAV